MGWGRSTGTMIYKLGAKGLTCAGQICVEPTCVIYHLPVCLAASTGASGQGRRRGATGQQYTWKEPSSVGRTLKVRNSTWLILKKPISTWPISKELRYAKHILRGPRYVKHISVENPMQLASANEKANPTRENRSPCQPPIFEPRFSIIRQTWKASLLAMSGMEPSELPICTGRVPTWRSWIGLASNCWATKPGLEEH